MDRLADISTFEAISNSGFDTVYNGWKDNLLSGARSFGRGLLRGASAVGKNWANGTAAVGRGVRALGDAAAQKATTPQQSSPEQQSQQTAQPRVPLVVAKMQGYINQATRCLQALKSSLPGFKRGVANRPEMFSSDYDRYEQALVGFNQAVSGIQSVSRYFKQTNG